MIVVLALAACSGSDVSRSLGARCTSDSDCAQRCMLPSGDWPGGFCTVSCRGDSDCPEGGVCIDQLAGEVCAFSCTSNSDCTFLGAGYNCQTAGYHTTTVKVCRGG